MPGLEGSELGLHGYEQVVEVGRGGFAVVYHARQLAFDRSVAIKILEPLGLDDRVKRRFERECKAMGSLSWHPNILTVYEAGVTDNGRLFLTMEYAPEGSLQDRLDSSGAVSSFQVARIGVAIASGLAAAHESGLIHCDVKPANVLLTRSHEVALADFGIAAVQNATHTRTSTLASVAFAAPEILNGEQLTAAADIYSLGATLFALLTGRPAFVERRDEPMVAIIKRVALDAVPDLRPFGVPADLESAVVRAMAKGAADRWPNAASLRDALAAIEPPIESIARSAAEATNRVGVQVNESDANTAPTHSDTATAAGPADGPELPPGAPLGQRRRSRRAIAALGAFVVVLVGVAGLALVLSHGQSHATTHHASGLRDTSSAYEPYVRSIEADLKESKKAVKQLDALIQGVTSCSQDFTQAGQDVTSKVITPREDALHRLESTPVPTPNPDNAANYVSFLKEALQWSIMADQQYQDWMLYLGDNIDYRSGCPGGIPTSSIQSYDNAVNLDHINSILKKDFAEGFDPVAKRYGLDSNWSAAGSF